MNKNHIQRSTQLLIFLTIILISMSMATPAYAADPLPATPPTSFQDTFPPNELPDHAYYQAIQRTTEMVWDEHTLQLAGQYGLNILNLTWEDTGRYYNSAVGPNISDVTIQIGYQSPRSGTFELALMPVIRYPNFSDLTADLRLDDFYLLVGNEQGEDLHPVSLREYLGNFRAYLSNPDSWGGRRNSLLAERDSHVLVSAQAAFLPIPSNGVANFNPVIFNYQSYAGDPAVLAIVATREGTSATVIDNLRDTFPNGFSWGQRLFFNQAGQRASFTGQRISDFTAENPKTDSRGSIAAGESGLNMVLLIQVPLKQKHPMFFEEEAIMSEGLAAAAVMEKSDVEAAVIGHGRVEGPFTEIDGLAIERDERFPIRVTVQFYKATSNGIVAAEDMQQIATQIERVYQEADYVGSLVVDGPSERPSEYDGPKAQPADWWQVFWQRFEDNTGQTPDQAIDLLRRLRATARGWFELP